MPPYRISSCRWSLPQRSPKIEPRCHEWPPQCGQSGTESSSCSAIAKSQPSHLNSPAPASDPAWQAAWHEVQAILDYTTSVADYDAVQENSVGTTTTAGSVVVAPATSCEAGIPQRNFSPRLTP